MITGFQKYLVDKGFKRTYHTSWGEKKEDYESVYLSSYNPLFYEFEKDEMYCWWGLSEKDKPPVMFLGHKKMIVYYSDGDKRTIEDGYRILFSKWKEDMYDTIYNVFCFDNKYFIVDCRDKNDIKIHIRIK